MQAYTDGVLWLETELLKRVQRNSRFSLRSFAKTLGISAAQLSRILSRKRPITLKMATSLASALKLNPQQRLQFLQLTAGISANPPSFREGKEFKSLEISMDVFTSISEWYHYALCELLHLRTFKNDLRWISKRLGISVHEARSAVNRLIRLGILKEERGLLVKVQKNINTPTDISSPALRKYHKQVLNQALRSLDSLQPEERDITSITFAMDFSRLNEAKEKIKQFRREMNEEFSKGQLSDVVHLCIQLFPVRGVS